MKPNRALIDGLREAARRLESGDIDYNWDEPKTCNCGVLASVLGVDITAFPLMNVNWSELAEEEKEKYCSVTKLPINVIMKSLLDVGVEFEDFEKIEFLETMTNKEWCKSYITELETSTTFGNKNNVIKYFRDKANELEIQLLNQVNVSNKVQVMLVERN